jgi:putative hemolysin
MERCDLMLSYPESNEQVKGFKRFSNALRFPKPYRRKVDIYFERKNFIVKTINSSREYFQVQKLRYRVFHLEYIGRKTPFGLDRDRFDRAGDLLAIIDKNTNKIVGTYRLISSLHSEDFYSATEFSIDQLIALPGVKLELSRACIHKAYRHGVVISLLWKGIGQYMSSIGADYLFGCSSFQTTDFEKMTRVYQGLSKRGMIVDSYGVSPIGDFMVDRRFVPQEGIEGSVSGLDDEVLPPLLKTYLKVGAKVCGEPALDRKFRCFDLFTVLKASDLAEDYNRKFTQ